MAVHKGESVRLVLTAAAALSALLLAQPATAQEQRGAIEGTVQDAQHAMLPAPRIAALNLAQGTAISTTADATGTFRFPALAPGYYDVTASLPGFTAVKFERVEVLLGQIKRLSFVLEIAAVAETVRVSVSSPLVDTRQSARVFSLRQDTIDLLPKGRDFTTPRQRGAGGQPGAEARGHLHRRLERLGEPVRHQWHRDHGPDQRPVGS